MPGLQETQTSKTRSIEGSISADGKILSGTGFSILHKATGVYIVSFDESFYFSPPSIVTMEVINPYIKPYGYRAEVIGDISTSQFKYFTYEVKDHELIMKDIAINYFYLWGYEKPEDESNSCY